jgi:hypothetical protein
MMTEEERYNAIRNKLEHIIYYLGDMELIDAHLVSVGLVAVTLTELSKRNARYASEQLDDIPIRVRDFPGYVCYGGVVREQVNIK